MSASTPQTSENTPVQRRAALLLACGVTLIAASHVNAQVQESRMSELLNPDRTKTSDFAGKTYASSATVGGKRADTRTYTFSRPSVFGGADGTFRTGNFADRGKFRTDNFAAKADRANNANSFAAADRGFATKALPVDEAPNANKSAAVRKYAPADKSIVITGKRQGDLDDLYHQQNLSIDQVREILNKPGHGTDAPAQRVGSAPILRAQPVTAPDAR